MTRTGRIEVPATPQQAARWALLGPAALAAVRATVRELLAATPLTAEECARLRVLLEPGIQAAQRAAADAA